MEKWEIIDRRALIEDLSEAFDPHSAEVLADVMGRVISQLKPFSILREDIRELKETVTLLIQAQERTERRLEQLAQAQAKTEERVTRLEIAVEKLAQAQARTEEKVTGLEEAMEKLAQAQAQAEERITRLEAAIEKLAQAQARTEERVTGLEEAMEKLAQAQARTEERVTGLEAAVEKLAQAQARTEKALQNLAKQVGGLSDTVGGDIEDIAYIVVHDVLRREYGWKVGPLERSWQRWDGKEVEVNLFGQATDPAHPDRRIWIVGEAKHNLTLKEVRKFVRQVTRARRNLEGEVFPVCFCYRARPEVQDRIRSEGIYLVFSYGKLVSPDECHQILQ
ncbi:TPA: hypothetical protein ENG04_03795 [Candidatus Poribacteria bacterium]|nr:hypothetical protein [Candidatus Poribacteria bacterium]HEX29184.1 hypothetical protein [Candidatus Poribacteria bacterium]